MLKGSHVYNSQKLPDPPAHLSEAAKQEWATMGAALMKLGRFTDIDRTAFAAYCATYARWAEAEEALKRTSTVVKSASGEAMLSPFYVVANQCLNQFRYYLGEFGMTPKARGEADETEATDDDPLLSELNLGEI